MVKGISCLLFSWLIALGGIGAGISVKSAETGTTVVSEQDMVKLCEGLDATTKNDTFEMGSLPYDIFNYKANGISDFFTVNRTASNQETTSAIGHSLGQVTSDYNNKFGLGVSAKASVQSVTIGAGTNFGKDIGNSLQTVNEEYYELNQTRKRTRTITVDWLSHNNLEMFFSSSFINELSTVNDLQSAARLLSRYGTHVFDRYDLGGVLSITEYIASQTSIQAAYEARNLEVSLDAKVGEATESNDNSTEYSMNNHSVNNETTKTKMNMNSWGGYDLNAITVQGLFTYNQEYATGDGSGYVYKEWLKSFDKQDPKEVVISAQYPVAIWDLIGHSSYHNTDKEELLQKSYDVLCYSNYSDLCKKLSVDSKIIGKISYKANSGTESSVNVTGSNIALPSNTEAEVTIGESITSNFAESDAKLSLKSDYDFVSLDGNKIKIADGSVGRSFVLLLKLYGDDVYSVQVDVKRESFSGGFGTEYQPYLISTISDFNSLNNSKDYYKSLYYFKVVKDLDFQGQSLHIGGGEDSFKGKIDGCGHILSNFNIVLDTFARNIGLFASNSGTIENLKIKNARLLNSYLLGSDLNGVYNAGLLVGKNLGLIQNINIVDSAIRLSFIHKDLGTSNVGLICGNNKGTISLSGVSDSFITGNVSGEKAKVNVGGICGNLDGGDLNNIYVRGTRLRSSLYDGGKSSFNLGAIAGHVAYDKSSSIQSRISIGVCYGNMFNQTSGNYGQIAGSCDGSDAIDSVYYEANQECAVANAAFGGCNRLGDLTLSSINNNKFADDWTNDTGNEHPGKPILKVHL